MTTTEIHSMPVPHSSKSPEEYADAIERLTDAIYRLTGAHIGMVEMPRFDTLLMRLRRDDTDTAVFIKPSAPLWAQHLAAEVALLALTGSTTVSALWGPSIQNGVPREMIHLWITEDTMILAADSHDIWSQITPNRSVIYIG